MLNGLWYHSSPWGDDYKYLLLIDRKILHQLTNMITLRFNTFKWILNLNLCLEFRVQ